MPQSLGETEPVFGPAPWPAALSGVDGPAGTNPCACGDAITIRGGRGGLGDLGWTVCIGLPGLHAGKPGHEVITREAALQAGIDMKYFDALRHGVVHADIPVKASEARLCTADPKRFAIEIAPGVLSIVRRFRRPIRGLGPLAVGFIYKQFAPHMQFVHALRNFMPKPRWAWPPMRATPETVAQTIYRMRNRIRSTTALIQRYGRFLKPQAFFLAGQALHTIQDSYSRGHVDRAEGCGRILNIRIFLPRLIIRADSRDRLGAQVLPHDPAGDALDAPANQVCRRAATEASAEYLRIILPSIIPGAPAATGSLDTFLARRLA